LHHVTLDRWSREQSLIHKLDARAKIVAALILLVGIGTTPRAAAASYAVFAGALVLALLVSRLPFAAVLLRAAVVIPFCAVLAAANWLAGDPQQAVSLTVKSYLSALTALLLVASTPLPALLSALEWFRVPALLIVVSQFLYRYLFVLSEQAQHMHAAAISRSGGMRRRKMRFRAAAGAVAVLFARSYARAEGIHRAMISRGFGGRLPSTASPRAACSADLLCIGASVAISVAARAALALGA
jgi:cobalt/nickel transport system permease protein